MSSEVELPSNVVACRIFISVRQGIEDRNLYMKKFVIAFTLLGLAGSIAVALAQDSEDYSGREGVSRSSFPEARRSDPSIRLRIEVDHLNRMFTHVAGEMQTYHAGAPIQAEYKRLLQDRLRLNMGLRTGRTDPNKVTDDVRRMHSGLHRLEEQMKARPSDYYQWR